MQFTQQKQYTVLLQINVLMVLAYVVHWTSKNLQASDEDVYLEILKRSISVTSYAFVQIAELIN